MRLPSWRAIHASKTPSSADQAQLNERLAKLLGGATPAPEPEPLPAAEPAAIESHELLPPATETVQDVQPASQPASETVEETPVQTTASEPAHVTASEPAHVTASEPAQVTASEPAVEEPAASDVPSQPA